MTTVIQAAEAANAKRLQRVKEYLKFPKQHLAENEVAKDEHIARLEVPVQIEIYDSGTLDYTVTYYPERKMYSVMKHAYNADVRPVNKPNDGFSDHRRPLSEKVNDEN